MAKNYRQLNIRLLHSKDQDIIDYIDQSPFAISDLVRIAMRNLMQQNDTNLLNGATNRQEQRNNKDQTEQKDVSKSTSNDMADFNPVDVSDND